MDPQQPPKQPERRKQQRRSGTERRDMIRFEPSKTPRRSGKDRRATDLWQGRDMF